MWEWEKKGGYLGCGVDYCMRWRVWFGGYGYGYVDVDVDVEW